MSAVRMVSMPCQAVLHAVQMAVSARRWKWIASLTRCPPSLVSVTTHSAPQLGQGTRIGMAVSSSALIASRQPVSLVVA